MIRSLPAILALGGLLATGALTYGLHQQVQSNGRLAAQLDQALEVNQQWDDHMAAIEERWAALESLDKELASIRQEQQANYQRLQSNLGRLRNELPEVREWADTRLPDALADSLCQRGTLTDDAHARFCNP